MPTLDVVKNLTVKATADGVDDATKSLRSFADAQGGVAVASDKMTKSSVSTSSALDKLQKSLDPSFRSSSQLSSAQTTLGKALDSGAISTDRYNQLMALASKRADDVVSKTTPLGKAIGTVQSQMVALSAGLGPVGVLLASFGPAGLAAGVGLAAIGAGFNVLSDQADKAGAWAQALKNTATVIDLNTTQLQALNEVAAQSGIGANDNATAFERFAVSLGQLRDGSGNLYSELQKVSPSLVSQLSLAKDATSGWNLLAKAYAAADQQQQALIAHAAFGKGGAAQGQVLLATNAAGGISGLEAANKVDAISADQIAKWALLKTQIDSATESASHNFQSIFTTSILTSESNFAEGMLKISRAAKEFALSEDYKTLISFLSNPLVLGFLAGAATGAVAGAAIGGIPTGGIGALPGAAIGGLLGGAAGLTGGIGYSAVASVGASSRSQLPPAPNFDATFGAVTSSSSSTQSSIAAASLGVQATRARDLVSALGSAATAQDRLDATTKQLNADLATGKITQDTYNKALGGAQLDAAVAKSALYTSTLGQLASVSDIVSAKALSLQKAQQRGAGLTADQVTAVLNLTRANEEWSRVNSQAAIGVFSLRDATKAAGDEFQSWIDKKLLDPSNPEQYAAAITAMNAKIQAAADTAKVAGSAFPQLTQLGLDAGNLNKQFDTFATTSFNAVSPALTGILNGTTTLSAGFKNLGLSVATALENMIIQLTIIKPLISALGSAFPGFGSLLGGGAASAAAPVGTVGAAGSYVVPTFHSGGLVNSFNNATRMVHPSAFLNAPRYHDGIDYVGGERPAILKVGERVTAANQNVSGAPQVNVTVKNYGNDNVSVNSKKNGNGGVDLEFMIGAAAAKSAATPGGAVNRVLTDQLGSKQRLASR